MPKLCLPRVSLPRVQCFSSLQSQLSSASSCPRITSSSPGSRNDCPSWMQHKVNTWYPEMSQQVPCPHSHCLVSRNTDRFQITPASDEYIKNTTLSPRSGTTTQLKASTVLPRPAPWRSMMNFLSNTHLTTKGLQLDIVTSVHLMTLIHCKPLP